MLQGILLPLLLPALTTAITIDCTKIIEDGVRWDLSKLDGPHQVHHLERIQSGSPNYRNNTYTIDICARLTKQPNGCSIGTRICSTKRTHFNDDYDPSHPDPDKLPQIEEAFPIAGEFPHGHGGHLDPYYTRLKGSDSHSDSKKEGVRIQFQGGLEPNHEGLGKVKHRAFVEFICDKERTGLEGPGFGVHDDDRRRREKRADKDDGEKGDKDGDDDGDSNNDDDDGGDDDEDLPTMENPDKGASLQFVSYEIEREKKEGTLRLEWRTKYACEDAIDQPDKDKDEDRGGDDDDDGGEKKQKSKSSGWGFFTWFIIILFLAIAAYLIFGSWLNYNRYGARGWDLLPHGDTIRDVPYLLKDWARRVFGGGSFGGSRDLGYIRV